MRLLRMWLLQVDTGACAANEIYADTGQLLAMVLYPLGLALKS